MKVIIVDDHAVVRLGLRTVLESAASNHAERVEVVADFDRPEAALAWLRTHCAHLVLMDMRFKSAVPGGMNGVEAVREIRRIGGPPVIVVTAHGSEPEILSALSAGAAGYVLKDAEPEELLQAVFTAAAGRSFLGTEVKERIEHVQAVPALTEREYDVLHLVSQGKRNTEIAEELFLSEATVKTHLSRIFDKTGARTRTAAVVAAREAGILEE